MEMIRHRVGIEAPPAEVLAKVATLDGLASWWTRDVTGDPALGGELRFFFGSPDPSVVAEVVESPTRRVAWLCTAGPDEWTGGTITFDIAQSGEETVLKFTQTWREPVDLMFHCSTKWGYFLLGLKASLEGGKGTPFPGELQISSWG